MTIRAYSLVMPFFMFRSKKKAQIMKQMQFNLNLAHHKINAIKLDEEV